METPLFKIIIIVDHPTRFDLTGKRFVIFKNYFLQDNQTGDVFRMESNVWMFAEYKEEGREIVVAGEFRTFDTLQRAFNYAAKKELEFL